MSFDGDYVPGTTVYGNWDYNETHNSSTWRELEAVRRVMYSNLDKIERQSLQVVSDNKNVKHILEVGSKKEILNDICLDIVETCNESSITLSSSWIPRNKNVEADILSRRGDNDDWGIQWWVFKKLDQVWGPHTYDRFASSYNRKCEKFSSKFWCEGCFCINAMSQRWSGENNWLVPPPILISGVVNKVLKEKAKATLIIPVWKSAPYWPLIHRQDSFISEVNAYLFFKGIGLDKHLHDVVEDSGVVEGSYLHSLAGNMCDHLLCSRSENTCKSYSNGFKKWQRFISAQGHSALPAHPVHIALYLTHLLDSGASSNTVNLAVYCIKWVHGLNGYSDPTDNSFVKNLQESAKRRAKPETCRKDPVTPEMLIKLCEMFKSSSDLGSADFGLHSMRSGGATQAANASLSVGDRCLKRHGRWKTDSSKDRYIADSVEKRLEVSKRLGI
ncbi:hypothetical protein FSP39_016613 [Pinctada imbricata]|uniref:Integrase SAM-like N-terminal domain-containing protein n=1 Tax=Pinctada imbricata TaxID=66713 RepID=A0AA88XG05_PINIB|nr:hypothetical protein FSP39_016613 [Pinctada imbricata]